jgi:hypothetical protein
MEVPMDSKPVAMEVEAPMAQATEVPPQEAHQTGTDSNPSEPKE